MDGDQTTSGAYGPVVLIVNPGSTRAKKGLAGDAERMLRSRGPVEVMSTRAQGEAEGFARDAVAHGAGVVVGVGGDGTLNEIASGLVGSDVALAPLPAGSTNVFARGLGWPARGRAALATLEVALAQNTPTIEVVLGRIQAGDIDRLFLMNAGAGVDAEAVNLVEHHVWLKHRLRHAGFAMALVVAERRLTRAAGLDLSVDGGDPVHVGAVSVACGAPFAYLGPRALDLVPGARHDGSLAWLATERVRAVTVARAVSGAMRSGRHVGNRGLLHGSEAQSITLDAPGHPFAVQVDGEPLGRHEHVTLSTGPRLRVLVP
jgi:diacylglycerol kinase family enzyme